MKTEPDWIGHDGSAVCPVPDGHNVEAEFRDGTKTHEADPELFRWGHVQSVGDIIRYRDWTAFYEQQKWRGPEDGLPPVGTECGYLYAPCDEWRRGTIVAHHQGRAVVVDQEGLTADCLCAGNFRPTQSDEDRAIEAMHHAVSAHHWSDQQKFEAIYTAIRDGKVPGVKLEDQQYTPEYRQRPTGWV